VNSGRAISSMPGIMVIPLWFGSVGTW